MSQGCDATKSDSAATAAPKASATAAGDLHTVLPVQVAVPANDAQGSWEAPLSRSASPVPGAFSRDGTGFSSGGAVSLGIADLKGASVSPLAGSTAPASARGLIQPEIDSDTEVVPAIGASLFDSVEAEEDSTEIDSAEVESTADEAELDQADNVDNSAASAASPHSAFDIEPVIRKPRPLAPTAPTSASAPTPSPAVKIDRKPEPDPEPDVDPGSLDPWGAQNQDDAEEAEDEEVPSGPPALRRGGGVLTIPLLCIGIAIIACVSLLPLADDNHRLAWERQKLQADLEHLKEQTRVNEEFLQRVADDPTLAERLAQRQMKYIRAGMSVLPLRGMGKVEMSPFHLVAVPPPPPMPEYQPVGGALATLVREPRIRLYLSGAAMLLIAAGLVLGYIPKGRHLDDVADGKDEG